PVVQPEDPRGQLHDPQRRRGLVHGDEAGPVERAEEERLPARRAGRRGGRVEVVGPAVTAQPGQVEDRGRQKQPQGGRPGPGGPRAGGAYGILEALSRTPASQDPGGRGHRRGGHGRLPAGPRNTQPRYSANRTAAAARLATTSTATSSARPGA